MDTPAHRFPPPGSSAPLLMGNGRFSTVITPIGTGFSMYGAYLLSSWQDDRCEDQHGLTLYLRDVASDVAWTACGALLDEGPRRTIAADPGGVTIACRQGALESCVTVSVMPDAALEQRELVVTNRGPASREIEVTAYLEVVLNHPAAHDGHPGFSKLFVQTRLEAGAQMLVATRRPRANSERHPAIALALDGATLDGWETDRARFIGRGRSVRRPAALREPLGGTLGNVLDPVLALRTRVALAPGESRALLFTLRAADAEDALALPTAARDAGVAPVSLEAQSPAAPANDPPGPLELVASWMTAGVAPALRPPALPPDASGAGEQRELAGNGYGEFSADGCEYRIHIRRGPDGALRLPPMPWTNVIANEQFGLIASEKGALSTFGANSRLHRITPWRNDPIADPHDEVFYVRDEDSGAFWSALPGPAPAAARYEVRHGFGYSEWQHRSGGLDHAVTVFVPLRDPLRIARIRLSNPGAAPRRITLYSYLRWVLGSTPTATRPTLWARVDEGCSAVVAGNPVAGPFAGSIGFAGFAGAGQGWDATADRREFLGTPGFAEAPRAVLAGGALSGGSGEDACAALRVELVVPPGGTIEVAALLGEAASLGEAHRLLAEYRAPGAVARALEAVREYWRVTLSATQVSTPCAEIDLMANGWLAYQTIACRLWARSAYYQSGGAYGFRDQLQDAAALALSHPQFLREQLLRNAAHQFTEGDVLHWWHPPEGTGIRTKFADDLVWLPYLTAHYVRVTGDVAVLDVQLPFVSGPELDADEDERYFRPDASGATATLYEHCMRALGRAMTRGEHGLPLFGCGDWNDGMNRVGRAGRGESVWMAFFLYATLGEFLPLSRDRGDLDKVAEFDAYRAGLVTALDDAGWDGDWYRRGYYDNGQPLGSRDSDECRIDALAQAWAVISGVASAERAAASLDSLEQHLVSEADGVVRLLAPPFERTEQDPGYIKGYVAGVRENGGQYTHAALWVVRAMAEAGRRERAARLLSMISPVSHTRTRARVERYKVEPYVVAADIYGVPPHVGRGGWTWYTGSAGWMLRVTLESLLGFGILDGEWLTLSPRVPDAWPGFTIRHRRPDGTRYDIEVSNPDRSAERVVAARLDGLPLAVGPDGLRLPLAHDGREHVVRVTLGPRQARGGAV